jgi:hypothetical protein
VKRALLLLALGGCSVLGTEQVPKHADPADPPKCNASPAPPLLDVAMTLAAGLSTVALYKDSAGDSVLLGIYGILTGLSAAEGLSDLTRCQRARAAHERWIHENYVVPE